MEVGGAVAGEVLHDLQLPQVAQRREVGHMRGEVVADVATQTTLKGRRLVELHMPTDNTSDLLQSRDSPLKIQRVLPVLDMSGNQIRSNDILHHAQGLTW